MALRRSGFIVGAITGSVTSSTSANSMGSVSSVSEFGRLGIAWSGRPSRPSPRTRFATRTCCVAMTRWR
jgi:hypothetical protein